MYILDTLEDCVCIVCVFLLSTQRAQLVRSSCAVCMRRIRLYTRETQPGAMYLESVNKGPNFSNTRISKNHTI